MSERAPLPGTPGRRTIGRLLEALQAAKFDVSTSEAVDATQLLLILAKQGADMTDPARLCARLRPIFCKSRDQQEKFDDVFHEWFKKPGPMEETPPPGGEGGETAVGLLQVASGRKLKRPIAIAVAILIAAAAIFAVWWSRRDAEPAPAASAAPIEQVGQPKPSLPGSATPPVQQQETFYGYFPALRSNVELRPEWVWLLVCLPLLALIGFSVPALVIVRTAGKRRGEPMYLARAPLEAQARRIVPPLRPDILSRLARHVRMSPNDEARLTRRPVLDVRATIEATQRNRGIPTPRYRNTQAHPSYLMLVDIANQRDPRGRMFYQWAERLQRAGLDVEIALVRLQNGQPQFAPTDRGDLPPENRWTSLARLPNPAFGQRLLLISAGEPLVDADGKWRSAAVAARFHRWRERAMFTPNEPRDWDVREDRIERREHTADPGFLVLPLDENALSVWTDLLNTGQLSDFVLSEPQRYPKSLRRGRGSAFVQPEPPRDPATLEKLVSQLRVYLGEQGFTWLAALAIPPLVRWELTLLLGQSVLETLADDPKDVDALLARNYQRLARLPWLRLETMPDWLRLRLIAELPQALQNNLRHLVESLLGGLGEAPGKDGIPLDFERPPGQGATGTSLPPDDKSDPLYLGYMSGFTAQQLAIRAPEQWGKWLGQVHVPREAGLRGWFARSADHTRAWWARRMFRGGMPFAGLRRGSYLWSLALLLVVAAILAVAGLVPPDRWIDSVQDRFFEEKTYAIAFDHGGPLSSVFFSADGGSVVTVGRDGSRFAWSTESGVPVDARKFSVPRVEHTPETIYTASSDPLEIAGLSPNGEFLVIVRGTLVMVWEARTKPPSKVLAALRTPETVNFIRFSPDSTMLLTSSVDTAVRLWALPSGNPAGPPIRLPGAIVDAQFSADGGMVATIGQDRTVRFWNSVTGRPAGNILRHDNAVTHAAFSPDGRHIVTATREGTARLWTADGQAIGRPLRHTDAIVSVAFSRDGDRVLTASWDKTARIWDSRTGKPVAPPIRHDDQVWWAAFSPDERRVVTASADNTAGLWDAATSARLIANVRHEKKVYYAAFSPDGSHVVTASEDGTARLLNAVTGRVESIFRHDQGVWHALFSPDSRRVVTASYDSTARVWDVPTGKPVGQPLRHNGRVTHAEFSPDSRSVVTSSSDGSARIWAVDSGAPLTSAMRHGGGVNYATFSPDGRWLATASDDSTARIWNVGTGRQHGPPLPHANELLDVSFDPASQRLITASYDGTAKIWSVERGEMLGVPLVHSDWAIRAAFSRDGRRVITGSGGARSVLTNRGYKVPENHAQVWHAYPVSPPSSSRAEALSHALPETLRKHASRIRWGLYAWAYLPFLIAAVWARRRQKQLALAIARAEGTA